MSTIIIGAGQAGLALSQALTTRGHDHVVLERGRVGERWRSERWASLRLLTPAWMTRLPGYEVTGAARAFDPTLEPGSFLSRDEVATLLERYAGAIGAPVEEHTTVHRVRRTGSRWCVETSRGSWLAHHVVIATGACDVPRIPELAKRLAPTIRQVTTKSYHDTSSLPPGGVLVVGAAATGVQLADELRASGRRVVLAVGHHHRLPRRYRGRDIMEWLDHLGALNRGIEDMPDQHLARREPSLQLVGRPDGSSIDLGILRDAGVDLAGRLEDIDGVRVRFGSGLSAEIAAADQRMRRLLARIDAVIAAEDLESTCPAELPPPPIAISDGPTELDLEASGITSVLWATGFRREYSWLDTTSLGPTHPPLFDDRGELIQRRGRTNARGLWVLGLPFQSRRSSTFLDGVGHDAEEVAAAIATSTPRRPIHAIHSLPAAV